MPNFKEFSSIEIPPALLALGMEDSSWHNDAGPKVDIAYAFGQMILEVWVMDETAQFEIWDKAKTTGLWYIVNRRVAEPLDGESDYGLDLYSGESLDEAVAIVQKTLNADRSR